MSRWSKITLNYWSFGILYNTKILNIIPRRSLNNLCSITAVTNEDPKWDITDFRVFGCPIYVLDPKLQVGKSPGKWAERSHQCIYIGPSPQHAGNVPLCFNPDTGNVSPQFHVVFDKHFETVSKGPNPMCPHKLTSIMDKLVLTSSWKYESP